MARKIRITAGTVSAEAELNDSPTADLIWQALPIEGSGSKWGDEIYFRIPVKAGEADDAQAVVERGDLGYWPPGAAFCIFYGPTPASSGDEIRPASPVNVVGKIIGDATVFKQANAGRVTIEKAE
jgi:hypothetical protein